MIISLRQMKVFRCVIKIRRINRHVNTSVLEKLSEYTTSIKGSCRMQLNIRGEKKNVCFIYDF